MEVPTCFPIALSASLTADVPGCHRAAGARARGAQILPGAHGELDIPPLWAPSPLALGWPGGTLAPRRAVAHTHRFLPEHLLLHPRSLQHGVSVPEKLGGEGCGGVAAAPGMGSGWSQGGKRSPGAASAASGPARQPSPVPSPADLPTSLFFPLGFLNVCFFRLCGLVGIFFVG